MAVHKTAQFAGLVPEWDSLRAILGIAADWIWEQDTEFRFSRLEGRTLEGDPAASAFELVGRTRWDLSLVPADAEVSWASLQHRLRELRPFRGVILRRDLGDGDIRFIRVSGAASFDKNGQWSGYRGFGEDVTSEQMQLHMAQRFQTTMDASPDCVLVTDSETQKLLYVNDTICELAGFQRDELLALFGYQLIAKSYEYMADVFARAEAGGIGGYTEPPHLAMSKNGDRRGWWEAHHRCVMMDGRRVVVTVSREITGRVLAEQAEQRARRVYAALSATNEAIMRAETPQQLYQQVCEAAIESGGLAIACLLLPDPATGDLKVAALAGLGEQEMREVVISTDPSKPEGHGINGTAFRTGKPCISEDFLNDPRTRPWHGVVKRTRLRAAAAMPIVREGKSVGTLYLGATERRAFDDEALTLLRRITENLAYALQNLEHEEDRKRAEEQAHYLATHDSLTGLPNRALFSDLLDQALATSLRYHHKLAVMFIDLDHFKDVNDNLGHAAGDLLLQEVARQLRSVLRSSDVLARMGGDEFVVLLPNVSGVDDATRVASKLLDAAVASLHVLDEDCSVSASIGISLFPDHNEDRQILMKYADVAMYQAKARGKNTWVVYSAELEDGALAS